MTGLSIYYEATSDEAESGRESLRNTQTMFYAFLGFSHDVQYNMYVALSTSRGERENTDPVLIDGSGQFSSSTWSVLPFITSKVLLYANDSQSLLLN